MKNVTEIQVLGNDTVAFYNGTDIIMNVSQVIPNTSVYMTYGNNSITLILPSTTPFTFSVLPITQIGPVTYTPLTGVEPQDQITARVLEIYTQLASTIFKGCCDCGSGTGGCTIEYQYNSDLSTGQWFYDSGTGKLQFNETSYLGQNFAGFYPILPNNSWVFLVSDADPTIYAIFQVANYANMGTYIEYDATLIDGSTTFVVNTVFCVSLAAAGGSAIVTIAAGNAGVSVTGSYPSFTISNDMTLTAGTNVTITGTYPNYIINSTGGGGGGSGTVTSIDVDGGTGISVSPAGPITTSGTFTVTNTAPDQVVSLTQGGTTTITGTYPNFTISSADQYDGTVTSVGLVAGTGVSLSGTNPITTSGSITVTNTAPDQVVSLSAGTGISTSGTYPSFTVTNTAPDQIVSLTAGTGISVSGTYPSFTIDNSLPFNTPLTTKGDIYVRNASADTRLPVGLDTQILIADSTTSTGLKWGSNTTPPASGYYGAWQDNVTQTAAASNTGYAMIFRTIDLSNGVTVVTNGTNLTRITFANTGVYNLQFSSQFQNTGNSENDVTIWLRLNGTDVPGSAGFFSVPKTHGGGAGTPGHSIASWNYLLDVVGGQYYELVWSTSNHLEVTMQYYAAGSPPPAAASVILTVTQQSGILAGTGITAINSLTGAVQTLTTGTTGTDFAVSSSGTTHTLNLPVASSSNTGKLSSTDWSTFNGKIGGSGTTNEIAYFTAGTTLGSLTTATYPSLTELSYVKGVTSSIQTQINSLGGSYNSYTMKANNTGASAAPTDQTFRYPGNQSFSGTITTSAGTWGAGSYYYNWHRIGNMVNYTFQFIVTTPSAITSINWDLPADMPSPVVPSGFLANSVWLIRNFVTMVTTTTGTTQTTFAGGLRVKSTVGPTFDFYFSGTSGSYKTVTYNGTYFTS